MRYMVHVAHAGQQSGVNRYVHKIRIIPGAKNNLKWSGVRARVSRQRQAPQLQRPSAFRGFHAFEHKAAPCIPLVRGQVCRALGEQRRRAFGHHEAAEHPLARAGLS